MAAVLVNPRVPLATPRVFAALGAGPTPVGWRPSPPPAQLQDLAALIAHVRERGNDLEAPAIRLLPVIAETKAALAAQPGCLYAAMSGSGPTCFGLFDAPASAARGRRRNRARQPQLVDCRNAAGPPGLIGTQRYPFASQKP